MQRVLPLALLASAFCACSRERPAAVRRPEPDAPAPQPVPVDTNPVVAVESGFRGEIHPLLRDDARLTATAHWSRIGTGDAFQRGYFPARFYVPFHHAGPAQPERTYASSDFSGLLPERIEGVGQMWSLDLERVAVFLEQFHPRPLLSLAAVGRRAGPNGAIGILRAVSQDHLEALVRIHAEFEMAEGAWFTPAHFAGRMLVDREHGTVEFFQLLVPTEQTLNATLTVGLPTEALIDIVHIDRMELVAGDPQRPEQIVWESALSETDARLALKTAFYRFMQIAWVPPEHALDRAQETGKPVMAVVLWGGLDDQSC